jgi:carboxyl-terminal processing protease
MSDPLIPEVAPPPVSDHEARGPGGRLALVIVLALVAVLGGAALFGAGFLLGDQRARTAGTPDDREALFAPFWDAFEAITGTFVGDADEKTLVEGAIKGMFEAIGDPFSGYLTSDEYRSSLSGISGSFEGIGAVMMTRDEAGEEGCEEAGPTCHIVVVRTLRDAPATRAGLRTDDRILAVDDISVDGQTLGETIDRVRGPRGTTVRLSVVRATETFELAIVRDTIQTEAVSSRLLADGTVGYIRLDGFSSSAAADFRDQLKALVDGGVTKIVFDLRGDPGGFVDAAERIASEFIASGPIFWEAFADGTETAHEAVPGGVATDPDIEVVVLVDGGSASASEIVAGALQDAQRARLVGEQTFGKGTIQQWQTLTDDTGGFRLSVARWLTPDKRWIHEQGLTPDVPVSVPTDADSDVVLDRALELLGAPTSRPTPCAASGSTPCAESGSPLSSPPDERR